MLEWGLEQLVREPKGRRGVARPPAEACGDRDALLDPRLEAVPAARCPRDGVEGGA